MSKSVLSRLLAFAALVAVTVTVSAPDASARKKKGKTPPSYVNLDGVRMKVYWNDGDSFRVQEGPRKGMKARLMGYNTLESYGPVHFWGSFHGYQLYDIAKEGTDFVRTKEWVCTSKGEADGYGRQLILCPQLIPEILEHGFAHAFAMDEAAPAEHIAAQRKAQNARRGIWSKGIPTHIVTSIHSIAENEGTDRKSSYNRVCDTVTGQSRKVEHAANFEPCNAWCYGGSCMVYVPFTIRYGKERPKCLKMGRGNKLALPGYLKNPLPKGEGSQGGN